MKKMVRVFVNLALLACAVMAVKMYLDAQKVQGLDGQDMKKTRTDQTISWAVAVYDQPGGADAKLISAVVNGQKVEILGQENGWWKITYTDDKGNVISGYVGLIEHLESSDEK
jgi:hypothetical protein